MVEFWFHFALQRYCKHSKGKQSRPYPILSPNLVRVIGTLVQFGRKWNVYPHNISRMELVLRMPNTTESSSCWCQTFGAFRLDRRGWLASAAPAADYAERIQRNYSVTFPTQGEEKQLSNIKLTQFLVRFLTTLK